MKHIILLLTIVCLCSCNNYTITYKIHKAQKAEYVKEIDKYLVSVRSTDGLMHEYECNVFGDGNLSKGTLYHWRYCKYCKEREIYSKNLK